MPRVAGHLVCPDTSFLDGPLDTAGNCELSCAVGPNGASGNPDTTLRCDTDERTIAQSACGSGTKRTAPSSTPPLGLPPNVMFVISDDWGWPYYEDVHDGPDPTPAPGQTPISVWDEYFLSNNSMALPNLDTLAERGAFFPIAHQCASVCLPGSGCLLTGRHSKDFEGAPGTYVGLASGEITSHSIADALHGGAQDKYCSIKVGKVWEDYYVDNPPVPAAPLGFDFDVGKVSNTSSFQPGRQKVGLDEAACLMRKVNRSQRPFFVFYLPVLPHDPPGAPAAFQACYPTPQPALIKIDGHSLNVDVGYRRNQSWYDCGLGRLMRFLEDTPDERYLDGNAKLIDTTLIVYATDNGNKITDSKIDFSENGYRTPMIFYFQGRIVPRVYAEQLVSVLDAIPTALGFAGSTTDNRYPDPAASNPKVPDPSHRGQNLRAGVIQEAAPYPTPAITAAPRELLIGHFSNANSLSMRGQPDTYLRTKRLVANSDLFGTPGAACVTASNPNREFACKYYQKPIDNQSRCTELLYNLVDDPDENTNLLGAACQNDTTPPFCYNDPCLCLYRNQLRVPRPKTLRCTLIEWTRKDIGLLRKTSASDPNLLTGAARGCAWVNTDPANPNWFAGCDPLVWPPAQ
jgi:hypothetical protein